MILDVCKCDAGIGNTGLPQGVKAFAQLLYFIITPTFDEDGVANFIDCTVPFDQAFLDGKLNEDDPTKRWYVVKNPKNVERAKTDPVTRDFGDGSKEFVRDGVRSFATELPGGTATFLGKLLQGKCQSHSFYEVDTCFNLGGNGRDATKLFPYLIGPDTINHFLLLANDTQNQSISINMDYDISEKDELRAFITEKSITADLTPRNVNSLIDVNLVEDAGTPPTLTTIDFNASFDYGDHCDKLPLLTLLPAELTLLNVDDALPVVVISIDDTDADNGNYQATFAIQDAAETIRMSILPSDKNGFEAQEVDVLLP